MQGLHLTADLSGVDPSLPLMIEPDSLRSACIEAVRQAGLGSVAELFHRFSPADGEKQSGITGVVLLAESHIAIHTWPELRAVTLDVYVCNLGQDNSPKAEVLTDLLVQAFAPRKAAIHRLQRGMFVQEPDLSPRR